MRDSTAIIAVSGGADSLSLLLALDELIKAGKLDLSLAIAHMDHGLRSTSAAEAHWVARLAKELGYETSIKRVNVSKIARSAGDNLEQAARRARYDFLATIARRKRANLVITAHTMNDQAETVLLNLLRGSGLDGLTGIDPVRSLAAQNKVLLVRPMVSWASRRLTVSYCRRRGVEFLVDEMNADVRFSRVRVRTQLLPLMQSFNPKLVETLARTAEVLREDNSALNSAADRLLALALNGVHQTKAGSPKCDSLHVDLLALAQTALRRRVLRRWLRLCRGDLRRIERVHVIAVETLLFGNRGGRIVELPGGGRVSRRQKLLLFEQ